MKFLSLILFAILGILPLKTGGTDKFSKSEEQVYICHYKWGIVDADVAKAHFKIKASGNGYDTHLYGHTDKIFDKLFKVRENFRSHFDAATLRSETFSRDAEEGKYRCSNDFTFLWDKGYIDARVWSIKKGDRKYTFKLEPGMTDVSTLLPLFRCIDMEKVTPGEPMTVKIAMDTDISDLIFKYIGEEEKDIKGLGVTKVRKFSLSITSGNVFDTRNPVLIYATLKDNVPVAFEVPLRVGRVEGHIESSTKVLK